MTAGRAIAVVGPSGVGKDSVIAGLAAALPEYEIARRAITRPPDSGGENHLPLTDVEFADQVGQGAFCLHWQAHGLSYGIPDLVAARAAEGQPYLLNLSRSVLAKAHDVFADLLVLRLSASAPVLAARLAGRNREAAADIAARLSRDGAQIPPHLRVIEICNDGALEDTVAAAWSALHPQRG